MTIPGITPGFEPLAVQLCRYIRNTGQVPLRGDDFDDDWSPVGDAYRSELLAGELIYERDAQDDQPGGIVLTAKGEALL